MPCFPGYHYTAQNKKCPHVKKSGREVDSCLRSDSTEAGRDRDYCGSDVKESSF